MSLKAVFFDLDGTLLDTAIDLGNALNNLLNEYGHENIPLEQLRNIVSDGAAALLKVGFNVRPGDEHYQELRDKLLHYYLNDLASYTVPFDGIEALIGELTENNIIWGIVTNKPWTYAEPLMKFFNFASAPAAIICPEHVKQKKPDPEALVLACAQAGCSTSEALYIGDHRRDIECGINAGMPTIAVAYGYIQANDDYRLWGADHYVEHAYEIWPLVQSYIKRI